MDTDDKIASSNKNKGFVVVWFVMLLPVVLLFAAMAMDFSYMYVAKGQLQNAADAAALAGAAMLVRNDGLQPTAGDMSAARDKAAQFALTNKAAGQNIVIDKNSDITFGYWDNHYTSGGAPINAIQVRAARDTASAGGQVPIIFGRLFGWDKMGAAAIATAAIPARATSSIALCPDFCQGGIPSGLKEFTPPVLMDTGPSTPSVNIYAWTSYDSNVTSTSDVRDLICSQNNISKTACGETIYSSMGTQANSLCNLESQMYNPYFDSGNKDTITILNGVNTTGWWMVVPITQSCPPGAQGNAWDPKPIIGYASIHVMAICTTGCGSGSIKAPCSSLYSAPSNVCNSIATKYGFKTSEIHNKMIIDKYQCINCDSSGSFFPARRVVLVQE